MNVKETDYDKPMRLTKWLNSKDRLLLTEKRD